jgi:hypothetical protein
MTESGLDNESRDRWATVGLMRSLADGRTKDDPAVAIALTLGAIQLERADSQLYHGHETALDAMN